MLGRVGGGTEGDWLGRELSTLFQLRNALIQAEQIAVQKRDEALKLLADYRTNLKLVKARTDEDNNNDIRIATQKILETEPLARSSTESSERPAPPAGGTAEKSEKQRPFAQLIADGYEINAVTLGLAEAGRWKNNHILVTLKKDKSVAVCSFPPPNWENMTDSTLADPKLCDVR